MSRALVNVSMSKDRAENGRQAARRRERSPLRGSVRSVIFLLLSVKTSGADKTCKIEWQLVTPFDADMEDLEGAEGQKDPNSQEPELAGADETDFTITVEKKDQSEGTFVRALLGSAIPIAIATFGSRRGVYTHRGVGSGGCRTTGG